MSTHLLTAAEVAELLQLTEGQVLRRTHTQQWPCVRISKKCTRFKPEHVEQIIDMCEREAQPLGPVGLPGQTARSRRRAAS